MFVVLNIPILGIILSNNIIVKCLILFLFEIILYFLFVMAYSDIWLYILLILLVKLNVELKLVYM